MPEAIVGFVALSVAIALIAYRRDQRVLYVAAKSVASLGFVVLAQQAISDGQLWERIAFAALAASALGDVALGFRGRKPFVIGLSAFALAHTLYSISFVVRGLSPALALALVLVALILGGLAWVRFKRALPQSLRVPIGIYACIICVMSATGIASTLSRPDALLALGVLLVPGSDIAVARERFAVQSFGNKLIGLPAYYVGQLLIALSMFG